MHFFYRRAIIYYSVILHCNLFKEWITIARDFQQTHDNLLDCAKKHFLKFGFERSSIREICKDAHVTNGAFYNHFEDKEALFGALVEPVLRSVSELYADSVMQHFVLIKSEDLPHLWELSAKTIERMIEYIYEHLDIFRLLLKCSEGTKYADFRDTVVQAETRETKKFFRELKKSGVPIREPADEEWYILVYAYYSAVAEIVMHDYSKRAALRYARTLAAFFAAGWKSVLGI